MAVIQRNLYTVSAGTVSFSGTGNRTATFSGHGNSLAVLDSAGNLQTKFGLGALLIVGNSVYPVSTVNTVAEATLLVDGPAGSGLSYRLLAATMDEAMVAGVLQTYALKGGAEYPFDEWVFDDETFRLRVVSDGGLIKWYVGPTKLLYDAETATNLAFTIDPTTGEVTLSGSPATGGSPGAPQGRLTLTAGSPVMSATVSGATTVYYSPYVGQHVPIYDGSEFVMTDIVAELSNILANSATGKAGPTAATTNSNYDLFVWDDAGTIRLTRGPLWTSATARGTGAGTTELERVKGLWVNKVAITNGPAAQRGTYVGTVRTNASSQVDFQLSGSAAGGSAISQHVWNAYNRIATAFRVVDTTASWNYTTALFRALNNSNENRIRVLNGLNEEPIDATLIARIQTSTAGAVMGVGLGLDANNARASDSVLGRVYASAGANATSVAAKLNSFVGLGSHYVQAIEIGDNVNANSVIAGGTDEMLMATVRC